MDEEMNVDAKEGEGYTLNIQEVIPESLPNPVIILGDSSNSTNVGNGHSDKVEISQEMKVKRLERIEAKTRQIPYSSTKVQMECCNEECDRNSNKIVTIPSHVMFYFGISSSRSSGKRTHMICSNCLEKAETYVNNSVEAFKANKPVFDIPFKPGCVSTIDLDIESDPEEDDEVVQIAADFEKEIDNMIKSYGIEVQTNACTEGLIAEFNGLETSFNAVENYINTIGKDFEIERLKYAKMTGPKYTIAHHHPLDIDEFGNVKIIRSPNSTSSDGTENFQSRLRKTKPKPSNWNGNVSTDLTQKPEDDAEVCEVRPSLSLSSAIVRPILAPTPAIIPRIMPKIGDNVFVMRSSTLNFWVSGEIVDVMSSNLVEFKVRFELTRKGKLVNPSTNPKEIVSQVKTMSAKHIAYNLACPFILPVATRIIARFKDEFNREPYGNEKFYAGIVAEPPKAQNNYRYLVFFDDGYAQYVGQGDVFLVCETSKEVWIDIHPDSQDFIKKYVEDYPERPMVRLQKGSVVTTEWNGKWWVARVVEVDCSLVKMFFEADNRNEWIYRGSTRLAPLFEKLKRQGQASQTRRVHLSAARFVSNSTIEYCGTEDFIRENVNECAKKSTGLPHIPRTNSGPKRNLLPPGATFSTSLVEYEGKMVVRPAYQIPVINRNPEDFGVHRCSSDCIRPFDEDNAELRKLNPLFYPMYLGWERVIGRSPKREISYRAPCGKRLKDIEELQQFLINNNSNMSIDYFCYDFAVDCLSEFIPTRVLHCVQDIAMGREIVQISCVNSIDHESPDYVEYTRGRLPSKDVTVNLDAEFMTCCDCTDDCLDKTKCSCWKMTLDGIKANPISNRNLEFGYQYRRLYDPIVSGIYECNQRCKCRKTCSNRVVQNPIRWQLQVFKTSAKGWAIRPLHDIPQGSFLCVYAGQILTDQGANEDGKEYGDEYLAELDYIEVMESIKEGYEHDVVEPSSSKNSRFIIRDSDDSNSNGSEIFNRRNNISNVGHKHSDKISLNQRSKTHNNNKKTKSKLSATSGGDDDRSVVSQHGNSRFSAILEEGGEYRNCSKKQKVTTRELFGHDEQCYIMDAKGVGNIGRYFNHCCQPNVFVQNVFVDTHDIRFPWVAFFTFKHIRAGTELTWDYNYDIGSVPEKTMYCYCGAPECRGRLL